MDQKRRSTQDNRSDYSIIFFERQIKTIEFYEIVVTPMQQPVGYLFESREMKGSHSSKTRCQRRHSSGVGTVWFSLLGTRKLHTKCHELFHGHKRFHSVIVYGT